MQREELECKEFVVAIAECLTVEQADFVVDRFERASGNGMVIPSQKVAAMGRQGVGEFDEQSNAGVPGILEPGIEELGGRSLVGLFPELVQVVFHVVSNGQRLIELQGT